MSSQTIFSTSKTFLFKILNYNQAWPDQFANSTTNWANNSSSNYLLNNNPNNNQTNNKTIFSDSNSSFFSDQYCSVGTIGCSFITVVSTFHILYIIYALYQSIPLWRDNFKQNRLKFFSIDVDQNQMRNILAYGVKIFLQVIGGIQAIIQLILVLAFHEKGWMIILEVSCMNSICCFSTAIFIYMDAISFQKTLRRTFAILFINFLQNIIIFAILLATNTAKNVDIFCFICSSLYIAICIGSTIYTHFFTDDFITINLEQIDDTQNDHSSSLLNSSQQNLNLNSDQNLLQQQHTTLDYGKNLSSNTSNNQNYQPPTQNFLPPLPFSKQKIEDESSSRMNKNNYKQMGGFSSKITTPQNGNNSNNILNNGSSSNISVQRSLSAQKTPIMIPITPEDSFSSINNYEYLSDDDETADQKSSNQNTRNGNSNVINKKNYNKKKNMNKNQQDRIQLANRSKSSIQCLGRQDLNTSDNSIDRIEEAKRVDQQISGLLIGDKWSGSVDVMVNNQEKQQHQSSNMSTQNTQSNTSMQGNLIRNLKQYHNQMNNTSIQQFQRQPTNQTDILHSSVEYLGTSNQFITPSFTNHQPHIESHTNSSSNRDSLYLSQQITTPQFNIINQPISSNLNMNSLQSSSTSSSKKPHSSLFSQIQQQIDQKQFGNSNISKKLSNIASANYIEGQQSPAALCHSLSIGADSGDTNAFQSGSANDNSEMSNQKQDSYQTSDSYLMNCGQNNNNTNYAQQQQNNQNQIIQKNQSTNSLSSKAYHQQQQAKCSSQNQNEVDKKQKEQLPKQKSLTSPPSQAISSKGIPQTDFAQNKTQDKQQVLNQMNDLLFKNKSSTCQQAQQQQQSPSQLPSNQERFNGKTQKGNLIEEQKRIQQLQSSNQDNYQKKQDNSNSSQQSYHRKHSDNLNTKSNDNQNRSKEEEQDKEEEDLGFYKERYSELKVLSFKQSEKFDKRTVVFNISYFNSKGEIVVIQRSYREFNDLHKFLSTKFKEYKFAEFPKKQNKLQLSSQELTDRTNQFNNYLQSVINIIKVEVNIINNFLSKDTICFSSQAVLKQQSSTSTNQGEQVKSFAQINNNNKLPYKKLNSLPNKPRSVPETIFEDANDCSNVLTDSNASQMENEDDYSSMSCNYQPSNKQSNQYSNKQNKNNLNSSAFGSGLNNTQSSKVFNLKPQSTTSSGKQFNNSQNQNNVNR